MIDQLLDFSEQQRLPRALAGAKLRAVRLLQSGAVQTARFAAIVALALPAVVCLWPATTLHAQPAATGVVQGRVQSAATGNFLNNARVRVAGSNLEVFTDVGGEFQLNGVPAGKVTLNVFYTGMVAEKVAVTVAPGAVAQQDVTLRDISAVTNSDGTVVLSQFVVQSQRETDAAAIAINEQRFAANRKDVISTDAFGDINQGNIGEFIKFIPGISLDVKDGNSPSGIMIRGFDPNYTNVTMDGGQLASTQIANTQTGSRGFLLEQANINNLSRIEVTKLPTPDMSANLLGGAVNFVSKSAFERSKQQLTFNAFLSANSKAMDFSTTSGPGLAESYKILPNFDLTYVNPVSKTFGIVVNLAQSTQFYLQTKSVFGRRYFTGTNATTANFVSYLDNPQTTSIAVTYAPNRIERTSGSIKVDWKPFPRHVLEFSGQANANYQQSASRTITFNTGGTIPVRWDEHNTFGSTGAAGTGSASMGGSFQNRNGLLRQLSSRWTYTGSDWLTELAGSYSNSNNRVRDVAKGFWMAVGTSMAAVNPRTVNLENFNNSSASVGKVTVLSASGQEIDPYKLSNYTMGQLQSMPADNQDTVKEVRTNVTRKLSLFGSSIAVKVGGSVNQMTRDARYSLWTTNYAGPDGILASGDEFMVSNQVNFIDKAAAGQSPGFGVGSPEWLSPWLVAQAFRDHPSWFVRQATNIGDTIRNEATRSPLLRETITAGYAMADAKFLSNRLRMVGGVRYEKTVDEGRGFRRDDNAIFQQDAAGHPIKVNNAFVLKPTLVGTVTGGPEQTALIYIKRGTYNSRDYAYFFPSLHTTFNVTENLLLRAAFAKTMGRPNISDVVPNLQVTDNVLFGNGQSSGTFPGTISGANSTLRPWMAKNYDYTLEYYLPRNGLLMFNFYKKDIRDFFSNLTSFADNALLDSLGLSRDYVGYQYSTRVNISDAMIKGWEASVNLPLSNLTAWSPLERFDPFARHFTLTLNTTHLELSGSRVTASDWKRYIPRSRNAGVRFNFSKLSGNFLLNWRGKMLRDTSTAINGLSTGGAEYIKARYQLDGNIDYQLTKHYAIYLAGRNILNASSEWEVAGPSAVRYAAMTNYENYGVQYTLGIRGNF